MFTADEALIAVARGQKKTLNAAFREWLESFTTSEGDAKSFDALMKNPRAVDAGRHFSKDELNQRSSH